MALTKDRIPCNSHVYYGNVFDQTYQPEETQSVINFKTTTMMHNNGSFLSFERNDQVPQISYPKTISHQIEDDYSIWEDNLIQDFSPCVDQSTSSNGGWPNSESNANCGNFEEFRQKQEECFNKRPHTGEGIQATIKKQCTNATRKTKPKSTTPSKDPQSVAAKNRREKISERLKILQELVPNGSKVDLVTMLEKAISYVKFLQLQVKVLATDEFWPVQGGRAPDISQVKEAIDAILSSQKDRKSISSE